MLAAFAQAESENYRALAQMTYRRKYEAGIPVYHLEQSFGFTFDSRGNLIPEPKEATWVKQIFKRAAEGYTAAQIARWLNEQGVMTKEGACFTTSTVLRILENEIYVGDYKMHKHYVNEERREVKNQGQVDAWYIYHDHAPLIHRKLWMAAHKKLEERREYLFTGSVVGELNEETYPYKDRIFCASCGYPLFRRTYSKENRVAWICSGQKRYSKTFCEGINVPDSVIRNCGDWSGNLYIRRVVDDLGKAEFRYLTRIPVIPH